MNYKKRLTAIDEVVQSGPFADNWKSLCKHKISSWFENAKFGIFIHWGVYSVPELGIEWYPNRMYIKDGPVYEHHIKTYGHPKDFGYKDFIPMFKAEKFDAALWADLFKESGARYVMPVAEHHDGFQMYASEISKWNSYEMGPKIDVAGELKREIEKRGMTFCQSSHRAEQCWYYNYGREYESDINDPEYADFYGIQQDGNVEKQISHDIYSVSPSVEHMQDWLVRTCEIIDKYRPKMIYFDWWVHNLAFKPYLKKLAAYYYNRAAQWGEEVDIAYKYNAFAYGSAVYDIERGQLGDIRPMHWQTDTSITVKGWSYKPNNAYKNPIDLVCDLVDIVSKNGNLMLNVGPKSDGTISEEETHILKTIGKWMQINSEGIYDTVYWKTFGEGPTTFAGGAFTEREKPRFTSEDIRFTYKDGTIYAFVMKTPENGKVSIKTLKLVDREHDGDLDIVNIAMLGYENKITFNRDFEALNIQIEGKIDTDYPICIKIEID